MTAADRRVVNRLEALDLLDLSRAPEPGLSTFMLVAGILPLVAAALVTVLWYRSVEGWVGMVWLVALIPIFVLATRKGWRGAALALAGGMVAMAIVELVGTLLFDYEVGTWFFVVVATVLAAVALGAGWVSERLMAERKRVVEKALQLALEDPETGLPTRRAAELFLAKEFAAARRGEELAVALFDLDGFAEVVERRGRGFARQLLAKVGDVFSETSRTADLIGRWGSQEFMAVLPGEDIEGAGTFAERVRVKAGRLEYRETDGSVATSGVTVSGGVVRYDDDVRDAEHLVERAHRALHAAKSKGGDSVVLFDHEAHGEGGGVGAPDDRSA